MRCIYYLVLYTNLSLPTEKIKIFLKSIAAWASAGGGKWGDLFPWITAGLSTVPYPAGVIPRF